jgi:hypothetical protein
MVRTQPETKVVYINGKPTVIHCKNKDGVPDFTGYHPIIYGLSEAVPIYTACEVKEAAGDSMVASRLSIEQRKYMLALPVLCSFVGIWWSSWGVFEVFKFQYCGSYKKGTGIN